MSEYIKTRLSQTDWEMIHAAGRLSQSKVIAILRKIDKWRHLTPQYREMIIEMQDRVLDLPHHFPQAQPGDEAGEVSGSSSSPLLDVFRKELNMILARMDVYEKRADTLKSQLVSEISMMESQIVGRLSLLATIFLPLTLLGTLFSMTEDVRQIGGTIGYWAAGSSFGVLVVYFWSRRNGRARARG